MKTSAPLAILAALGLALAAARADTYLAFRPGVEAATIPTDAASYECSPANTAKAGFSNGYEKAEALASPLLYVSSGPDNRDSKKSWLGFPGLFGSGPGQIPYGSTITSALLRLVLANPNRDADATLELHRIENRANAWFGPEIKSTWAFKDKAQSVKWKDAAGADVENLFQASSTEPSTGEFKASAPAGTALDIDVTKTVAAWAAKADGPDANLGWSMWLGTEGTLVLGSPTHPNPNFRPTLLVQFAPPANP